MSVETSQAPETLVTPHPTKLSSSGKTSPQSAVGDHEIIDRIDQALDLIAEASNVTTAPRPVDQFDVSIIIPAYNQIDSLPVVLRRISEVMPVTTETIVVDDGSTDGTSQWLSQMPRRDNFRVVQRLCHHGKGSAIRVGIRHCRGRVIAIQSGSLEYDPVDLLRVIWPVLDGDADVAYGSRYLEQSNRFSLLRRLGHWLLNTLGGVLTGLRVSDMEIYHKAFDRDLISSIPLRERGWEFDWEITAKIAQRQVRMMEVPTRCHGRGIGIEAKPSLRERLDMLMGLWSRTTVGD